MTLLVLLANLSITNKVIKLLLESIKKNAHSLIGYQCCNSMKLKSISWAPDIDVDQLGHTSVIKVNCNHQDDHR